MNYNHKNHIFQTFFTQKIFILFLALFCLIACTPKAKFQISPNATILAFGDSLTSGYGASDQKNWPFVFSQLSGYKVINSGISGNTTQDGLERIEEDMREHKPSLVILSLGGNDFLRQQPSSAAKANLQKIISVIESHQAHVVLVAQPAPNMAAAAFSSLSDHSLYTEIAKENEGVYLISGMWSGILSKSDLKSDLIHANDKGYDLFAQQLLESLKKAKIIAP